jgi:signal transduction histidine kinase
MDKQRKNGIPGLGVDTLSHDIKNIFNNISSSMELCRIFLSGDNNTEKLTEQFNIVSGQLARGIKLISNAQKISDFSEVSYTKKSIDILPLIEQAKNYIQKNFRDRIINIRIESFKKTLVVEVDENINELFENLLINAILHNMNTIVDIDILISKSQKDNKKFLKLEFIDNGIGLTDDRKEWIFEESFKKEQHRKGMGFGLYLVKKIIENHDGFIWVENRIKDDSSKGSNFVVLLPES